MRTRDERGTVTAFVTITTVALLLMAGLVHDGGRLLATRRRAFDLAAAAARAGAQELDPSVLRSTRRVVIAPGEASASARAFLARQGQTGTVKIDGGEVEVTVRIQQRIDLLSLVGLRTVTVSGVGHARLVRGVSTGEP